MDSRVASVFNRFQEVVRNVLQQPDLSLHADMVARDVEGWDSVAMIDIILAVQADFGIRLESSEIDAIGTVGDFARAINRKTS